LHIGAAPGLHEEAFALLHRHRASGHVLDLGTGSGAFAQRLLDHGYGCVGLDTAGYQASAPAHTCDLNDGWPRLGPFDAITAVELIEHLENPRHFFRQAHAQLGRGGHLLVTTPNIDSIASRAFFVATGRYRWFEDGHYASSGHITPLAAWQISQAAHEAGFEGVDTSASSAPRCGRRLRLLSALLAPLMRGARAGDIAIYLFARS
jgi:2-polyprenyl-3-methyl-5-hydroxy-6-metoxy-1,4-benzoquinol methylase